MWLKRALIILTRIGEEIKQKCPDKAESVFALW